MTACKPAIDAATRHRSRIPYGAALVVAVAALAACGGLDDDDDDDDAANAAALVEQGRLIFRFDTFGDEVKWTDTLRLHEAITAAVSPAVALAVGLKVDSDALPAAILSGLQNGTVDLASPATTIALLKLDAVIGLKATVQTVNGVDQLTRIGTTCALCHSTVDNLLAPGIGRRLDGWPNRDLNPGAIIALSPALDAGTKATLATWGRGKYDPRWNIDGLSNPVVIPPAYGLQDIHRITFTGDGEDIAYWNRYVAVTQMGALGTFTEPRLNLSVANPGSQDLVTAKLPALQAYQLSLTAPPAPAGSFDAAAAARGQTVFQGAGGCVACHAGPTFTDANTTLHLPADSMAEPESPSYAARSATKQYRTSPLRGVWQHPPYFHNGQAATLADVVSQYNTRRALGLSAQQQSDLVEYLKSL